MEELEFNMGTHLYDFVTNWQVWLTVFSITLISSVILYFVVKAQEKYVTTLVVGDVVNYEDNPAKVLEVMEGKVRIETIVPMMRLGSKVDDNEHNFD